LGRKLKPAPSIPSSHRREGERRVGQEIKAWHVQFPLLIEERGKGGLGRKLKPALSIPSSHRGEGERRVGQKIKDLHDQFPLPSGERVRVRVRGKYDH